MFTVKCTYLNGASHDLHMRLPDVYSTWQVSQHACGNVIMQQQMDAFAQSGIPDHFLFNFFKNSNMLSSPADLEPYASLAFAY